MIILWLENDKLIIRQTGTPGTLRVQRGGMWTDEFGQRFTIEGNLDIGALQTKSEKYSLHYSEYPDLFNQLFGALSSHNDTMIVTAKPGYTLLSEGAPVHVNGGEHGGLHKSDTITSMIVAGTDKQPIKRRMHDLKEYFLSLYK
ncbi:hypothetical protein GN156_09605 [bacterium LRH843]|nr:hypothetical protein [bacterium LRH843]